MYIIWHDGIASYSQFGCGTIYIWIVSSTLRYTYIFVFTIFSVSTATDFVVEILVLLRVECIILNVSNETTPQISNIKFKYSRILVGKGREKESERNRAKTHNKIKEITPHTMELTLTKYQIIR